MTSGDRERDGIVGESDLDWREYDHGRRRFRRKQLGAAAGSEELGVSLYELEPGDRTWPPHYHTGNEEAVYVLDGALRLRLGTGEDRSEHDLAAGDYVALPAGEDHTHEVEAAGETAARFLVVSTMNEPDMSVQPEAGVVSLFAGGAPGNATDRTLSKTLDIDAEVEYWDE